MGRTVIRCDPPSLAYGTPDGLIAMAHQTVARDHIFVPGVRHTTVEAISLRPSANWNKAAILATTAPPVQECPMAIKFGRPIEARVRFSPEAAQDGGSARLDLTIRPRRNRKAEWVRRMVREHVLTADDLIWPVFLVDGERVRVPVASMPGSRASKR